jgi:hypothetical protein
VLRLELSCEIWCSQGAQSQPQTPPPKARSGLNLEISTTQRHRLYKKRGAPTDGGDDDNSSDRIKVLTEKFVGVKGRIHTVSLVYDQRDINENFSTSEHAAVAVVWSGSGVGKIAKDYRAKKGVSMLGNAFDGMVVVSEPVVLFL